MTPGCAVGSPTLAAGGMVGLSLVDLDRSAGDDVGPTGLELGGRTRGDLDGAALQRHGARRCDSTAPPPADTLTPCVAFIAIWPPFSSSLDVPASMTIPLLPSTSTAPSLCTVTLVATASSSIRSFPSPFR